MEGKADVEGLDSGGLRISPGEPPNPTLKCHGDDRVTLDRQTEFLGDTLIEDDFHPARRC